MATKVVPSSVVKRLTKYLDFVRRLVKDNKEWISSQDIADNLNLTSSTVRQDLTYLNFSGVPNKGYSTESLQDTLIDFLGADRRWSVVVVGAGNLGSALAMHEEFSRRGFLIKAIFDTDKKKVGQKINQMTVRFEDDLIDFVVQNNIEIGVIAVPAAAAQDVADTLVKAGVRGVLNLAQESIKVPDNVAIIDSLIVASMQELVHSIITKDIP